MVSQFDSGTPDAVLAMLAPLCWGGGRHAGIEMVGRWLVDSLCGIRGIRHLGVQRIAGIAGALITAALT